MGTSRNNMSSLRTVRTFMKKGTCSETCFCVLNRAFEEPLSREEEASALLAGGVMQHGYQCGLVWGAALAAGAQAYKQHGAGPQAETRAVIASQKIVTSFQALNKNRVNCHDITHIDKSSSTLKMVFYFLLMGGTIGCFRRAARYAPAALYEINDTLTGDDVETPSGPVSCAAEVAKKMGASAVHATMAAGLAGGIGLSGGGCGALGAAIWLAALKTLENQEGKIEFNHPEANAIVERFLKCTDFEFECEKILGRKFENVADHAQHLCNGGCAKLIEVLAAKE